MREMHSKRPKFSKFSGGACPRTPLEARALRPSLKTPSASFSISPPTSQILPSTPFLIENPGVDKLYCLIVAFNTFVTWLIAVTSRQLNAGFFSLADIAFQGFIHSAVIIIVIMFIIFLHHHVRESSSCADETHSLHGAAERFYAIQ